MMHPEAVKKIMAKTVREVTVHEVRLLLSELERVPNGDAPGLKFGDIFVTKENE